MTMPATTFAASTMAELVEDRRPTLASDRAPSERVLASVAGELRALTYQVAEMAEHEPHQLVAAAEYLHGLLGREPLRSGAAWEPQRVVLGLFLLGLTNALTGAEVITDEQRAALRPAYQQAAIDAVTSAFDPTYVADPSPEEDALPPETAAAPELTDDDAARYL